MKLIPELEKWDSCLIIGFGDDIPHKHPDISQETLIISVDGGHKWAELWGLTPHLVIGDMDSLDSEERQSLVLKAIPFQEFPVEKDQTDLELAVDYALSLGILEIVITGAWGGRIDHSLGNLEILYKLGQKNINARLVARHSEIILVNRFLELQLPMDTIVSLIPLTPIVTQVSTEGLYYPLTNSEIKKGQTVTISNKTVTSRIKISTKKGILVAVVEFKS